MIVDDQGRIAGQRTATAFEASTDVAADYDDLLHRRRSQRRSRAVTLAAAAVVAVLTVLSLQANLPAESQPQPMQPAPGLDVGEVPVWYDAQGLHRGNIVERTAAEVEALALVRSGAVYRTPATGEVWFHPWGGDPHVVGHNVIAGPGGDPEGDTAAWFEASELVVYDTAAGRVVSRTLQSHPMEANCLGWCAEHYPAGSNFLQVSAERLVWNSGTEGKKYNHDVSTGKTSEVSKSESVVVVDLHDDAAVMYNYTDDVLVLRTPSLAEQRYPKLEPRARLSPSGNYVLAVEATEARHAAATVDTRTGEIWRVPKNAYPWIGWAYGDIALVDTEDELLACDASRGTCETLTAERPFIMPTT